MDFKQLYQQAISNPALRCDPISMLEDLETVAQMAVNGYETERVSPKGQVIVVIEKQPEVMPRLVKTKLEVLELLKREQTDSYECKLIVTGLDLKPPSGEMQRYP